MDYRNRIAVIGGCGHVGLPLGIALAGAGHRVRLIDTNAEAVALVNRGELPFLEEGGEELLRRCVGKSLTAETGPEGISDCDTVCFVTGTPVDEHLNPRIRDVLRVIEAYLPFLSARQLIVMRSTVFPGVTELVETFLRERLGDCRLAFCPERIAQGKGVIEIGTLPQIVSGSSSEAEDAAAALFATVAPKIIRLSTREAELAKLMTNTWRYIEFAIANQFYMMAESSGLDFFRISDAIREDYPRAAHFAGPGLAAGPCLFKDTMQLSAFFKNNFMLGHSAMLINEGLPEFLIARMEELLGGLRGRTVAILGMAFKADNDDTRESLSFKLAKALELKMARVICCDPYWPGAVPLEDALARAEGIILGVPHREYRQLKSPVPFVDCWGVWREHQK